MSHNGTVVQPNGAKPLSAPKRRTFTAEYKLRILVDIDGCHAAGAVGALLRREGLYSSHLVEWRRQRASGELQAGATKVRGRKPTPGTQEVARLQQENERLRAQLAQAELIIGAQKKLAQALEHALTGQSVAPS